MSLRQLDPHGSYTHLLHLEQPLFPEQAMPLAWQRALPVDWTLKGLCDMNLISRSPGHQRQVAQRRASSETSVFAVLLKMDMVRILLCLVVCVEEPDSYAKAKEKCAFLRCLTSGSLELALEETHEEGAVGALFRCVVFQKFSRDLT